MKISVITYVKNGLPYIKECVSSICNQTLRDIEIIVVDAGSTDGTIEYLHQISSQDSRVRIISAEPSVGKQFNLALQIATGEYVAICEADDYILPNMYEKLWEIAESTQCDVIRSDYEQFIGDNNKKLCFRTHCGSNLDYYGKVIDNSTHIFVSEGVNGFWSGLYKRNFLLQNGITMSETPGAAYQDVGFSFKCQCLANTVYFNNEIFYQYRLDNPNASMNVKNRVSKMLLEFANLEAWLKGKNIWNDFFEAYFNWELVALKKAYINISEEDKSLMLNLIVKTIYEQMRNNNINSIKLCENKKIESFITDQETEKKRLLDFFGNIDADERKIVIFGVGFLGQVVTKIVTFVYEKEYYLVDNNVSLQGKYQDEHEIISLKKVLENEDELVFLVANVNHSNEIKEQLLYCGVDPSNIYICNNDELLLRGILIKSIGR